MITRHDNGDGTTTFRGVDVTIPTSVAEIYDVVEVRRATEGEHVACGNVATVFGNGRTATSFPILKLRPTWKPPASLAPGKYEWDRDRIVSDETLGILPAINCRRWFCDWTDPPNIGKWQVNDDGTATYLGEA